MQAIVARSPGGTENAGRTSYPDIRRRRDGRPRRCCARQCGTGCNGVINPFVWYCAPWDNNNGAKYPYFKKKTIQVPAAQSKVETKDGTSIVLYNGNYYPLVASGAGNLVASGAGNLTVVAPN